MLSCTPASYLSCQDNSFWNHLDIQGDDCFHAIQQNNLFSNKTSKQQFSWLTDLLLSFLLLLFYFIFLSFLSLQRMLTKTAHTQTTALFPSENLSNYSWVILWYSKESHRIERKYNNWNMNQVGGAKFVLKFLQITFTSIYCSTAQIHVIHCQKYSQQQL